MTRKYLSVAETATYLGCSLRTVKRMLKRKTFPHHKIGRRVFIDPDELRKALERHKRAA